MSLLDTIDNNNDWDFQQELDDFPIVYEILDLYRKLNEYERLKVKDGFDYIDRPTKLRKLSEDNDYDFGLIDEYKQNRPDEFYDEGNLNPRDFLTKVGNDLYITEFQELDNSVSRTEQFILPTIEKGFNEWYRYKEKTENVKISTLKYYKSSYKYLKLFYDTEKRIGEITDKDFRNISFYFPQIPLNIFKYERFNGLSLESIVETTTFENLPTMNNKTINNHLVNFKSMFDFFIERGYITINPVRVKLLKEKESEKTYFEEKDLQKLFTEIKEKDIKDFIKISLYSGMRLSEIVNMKKEDIYDSLFHIRDGKTKNSTRIIHIHSEIKDLVNHYLENNEGDFLIFDGRKDPIQKRVNRRIQPIINNSNKTFHSCRKNFIKEVLKIEPEIRYLQMIVGHQVSEGTKLTTQTYGNEIQVPPHIMRNYVESVSYNF